MSSCSKSSISSYIINNNSNDNVGDKEIKMLK